MLVSCMLGVADGTLVRVFTNTPKVAAATRVVFPAGYRSVRLINGFIVTLAATVIARTIARNAALGWDNKGYVSLIPHRFIGRVHVTPSSHKDGRVEGEKSLQSIGITRTIESRFAQIFDVFGHNISLYVALQ